MKPQIFFRNDLNLMNRWWHRLFLVIFIVLSIMLIWTVFSDQLEGAKLPKYVKVGALSDRMTNDVQLISKLVSEDEKIANYEHNLYGSYLGKRHYDGNGGWLLRQNYFCAKNISTQVEVISQLTGVRYYKGNSSLINLDEFKDYLRIQKADCIQNLKLNPGSYFGDIENVLVWGLEADDMAIWRVSILKTIFAVFLQLLLIIIALSFIVIIYYKVLLFIVFGKYKENDTSQKL